MFLLPWKLLVSLTSYLEMGTLTMIQANWVISWKGTSNGGVIHVPYIHALVKMLLVKVDDGYEYT